MMYLLCAINNYLNSHLFVVDNFQVTDDKDVRRQIILTTFRKEKKAMVYVACVPLILSATWDCIKINLAKVTNDLFRAKYVETVKIQVSVARFDNQQQHCCTFTLCHFPSPSCSFSSRFIQTVGYEEYISPTDSTLMKSCPMIIR